MLSDCVQRRGGASPRGCVCPAYEPIRVRAGAGAGARESVGLRVVTSSEIVTVRTRDHCEGVAAYHAPPGRGCPALCPGEQRGGA